MFIKRKEFEELKNRVEVLEFQRDRPHGLGIIFKGWANGRAHYYLAYIKNEKIKTFALPSDYTVGWNICENNILIRDTIGYELIKYKFDIANEILIELQEPQKEEKPKKKSVKGKTKVAKNKQKR